VGISLKELGEGRRSDVEVFKSVLSENVFGKIVDDTYCPQYDEEGET